MGAAWEIFVLTNLMSYFPKLKLYFYRTSHGAESYKVLKLKKYIPKISLSILLVMAFVMPIHIRSIPFLITLFVALNLVDGYINKTFVFAHKRMVIAGILFYLVHLISVFYSDDKDAAWFDMEVKFSLLLFPLIFLFKSPLIIEKKKWVLISFALGTIVSAFIMLIFAYFRFDGQNTQVFYYTKLSLFHPSYLSMYFIFAILIVIKIMVENLKMLNHRIIAYLIILFLLILISQLQSKAGILSIIFISFYYLIFAFIRSNVLQLRISFFVLAVSLSLVFVQKESRFKEMTHSMEKISEGYQTTGSTGTRYSIWKVAIQEIKGHWLIGVGAGDIKSALVEGYNKDDSNISVNSNLNVHCQYLETLLGQGIIGLSILLYLLFLGVQYSIKRKELFLSGFILLIILSMGPESMLNKQAGVVFVTFFYYFLFTVDIPNSSSIKAKIIS